MAPIAFNSANSEPRSPIDAAIRFATAIAAATSDSTVISTITACVLFSTSPCSAATWRTCLATAPGSTSSIWYAIDDGYAVQYHVSHSSCVSAFGFFDALRARSLSGVVSALTSILSMEFGRFASVCAAMDGI